MNELKEILKKVIDAGIRGVAARKNLQAEQYAGVIHTAFNKIWPQHSEHSVCHKASLLYNELTRDNSGTVTCKCCEIYSRKDIRQHLMQCHGLTVEAYRQSFPDAAVLCEDTLKIYSDKFKGERNPGFEHGGRLSPNSARFVKYSGLNQTKLQTALSVNREKISVANRANGNNNSTLAYYLKQGMNEQEALDARSERQVTFSLGKCIERHGEIEGTVIWEDRQNKWQKTLNAKSPEEIDRINMGKSTGRMTQLFLRNPAVKDIPGIVYYIRFYGESIEFWKIGITSKTIDDRFSRHSMVKHGLDYEVLRVFAGQSFYDSYKLEQQILRENSDKRIIVNHKGFTTTEAFSSPIDITSYV